MLSCEMCRGQLLEYVYGLLDGSNLAGLEGHLATCPACQAELLRAQGQRRLLATAAKSSFAAVRFEPAGEPAGEPPTVPMRAPKSASQPRRAWRLLAAAAALVALGLPAASYFGHDYSQARDVATERESLMALARSEKTEALKELRKQPYAERDARNELARRLAEQQLAMVVTGPTTLQPGAPNQYHFEAYRPNGQRPPADVEVRVVDRDHGDRVVYQSRQKAANGAFQVDLPADLPLTPDSRLALDVVATPTDNPAAKTEVREELALTVPVLMTHLTTDKPMYTPGEKVRFRSLTLDRFSLKPAEQPLRLSFTVKHPDGQEHPVAEGAARVNDVDGKPIRGPDKKPLVGLGAGEFTIDANAPGGEYTLTVREAQNRFPEQQRKFLVNHYERSRLNKKLDFSRKSYGPGEEVSAACEAVRAEGGQDNAKPLAVEATLNVDGRVFGANSQENGPPLRTQTDAKGKAVVKFKLPPVIERGESSLTVTFSDGGVVESLVRPVPLVVNKLLVDFYPEGGYLVAGVPNRVYFQVRTPLGKPADLTGHLVDETGAVVVGGVHTLNDADNPGVNQGMGLLAFTPSDGKKYELKIDAPAAIEGRFELKDLKPDGVALSILTGAQPGAPLNAIVHSSRKDRSLLVGAYCRGRLLDHQQVEAKAGQATPVTLNLPAYVGGVIRVTVFEALAAGQGAAPTLNPVAERLVYHQPGNRLNIKLSPDKTQYVPGDKVKLNLQATDEAGRPAPAIFLVAVVDKNVLSLADEKTAKTMPTQFYLASEIKKPEDLENADFLLTDNPKARDAVDLLLGTQGWRRFAEQNPGQFRLNQPQDAERLLVSIGQTTTNIDMAREQRRLLEQKFGETSRQLQKRLDAADARVKDLAADPAAAAAATRLAAYRDLGDTVRRFVLPPLGVILIVVCAVILTVAFLRRVVRLVPAGLIAAGCGLGLLALAYVPSIGSGPAAGQANLEVAQSADPPASDVEAEAAQDPNLGVPAGDADKNLPAPAGKAMPQMLRHAQGGGAAMMPGMAGRPMAPRAMMPMAGAAGPAAMNANGMAGRNLGMLDRAENLDKRMDFGFKEQKQLAKVAEQARMHDEAMPKGSVPRGGNGAVGEPGMPDMFDQFGFPPLIVREYAHERTHGSAADRRTDFTETLFWHPVLVLPDGKGEVSFELNDTVTTFQGLAYAHSLDGRLGAATANVVSKLPFVLEPKVPIEVTSSDRIALPVSIANNTGAAQQVTLSLTAQGLRLDGSATEELKVEADGRTRRVFRLQPTGSEGEASVTLVGRAGSIPDEITRTLRVVPEGFPINGSVSEILEGSATGTVVLPPTWLPGTLKGQVQVYPSTLADLQKGLEALLREPGGCFEQTSTSNYPNLLILNYLKESDQARPEVERRASDMLARGYGQLVAFECVNPAKNNGREGYEWFGGAVPAHEALTAYGLMQFRDMARVYPVDAAMVERTRTYLLSRKDGKGGFLRNDRALDTFGRAPADLTNAYIVWALTEGGKDDDVTKELAALTEQAKASKDPYLLALVANSLLNRGQNEEGIQLLQKLAAAQKDDGHLDAERTSITGSGGRDLQIETTGLAVLAWLKANRPNLNPNVQKAVKWLGQQRGGYGGFGSTQSTILALKALIAYAKANKKTPEAGELRVLVGDRLVNKLSFPAGAQDALTLDLPEAEKLLKPGKNEVRVEITGKNVFPYTVAWSYQTLQPPSADNCPVKLTTRLDKGVAVEGDTVRLTAVIENASGKGQGMAVAIVGLPAGLSLPENLEQLKKHARLPEDGSKPLVSHFEIRGRELVLYWRDLAPGQKIEVPVDLSCRVPGEYRGPASRAYLYYNADTRCWVEPLAINISPKGD